MSLQIDDTLSSIITGNIAGIYPRKVREKLKFLEEKAETERAFVIALTESHLREEILPAEINIANFQLYRSDRREGTRGGGVVVYVRNDFAESCGAVETGFSGNVEYLHFYIKSINAIFITIYKPPECQTTDFKTVLMNASDYIDKFATPIPNIIMMGDFNVPSVNWESMVADGTSRSAAVHRQERELIVFAEKYCLEQIVTRPTRENNILDLFFTNNIDMLYQYDVCDSNISDHRLVTVKTKVGFKKDAAYKDLEGLKSLHFYSKCVDWENINKEFKDMEWENLLRDGDVDECYKVIRDQIGLVCSRYVPTKKKRQKKIPRDRKILMRKRTKLTKRLATCSKITKLRRKLCDIDNKLIESIGKEISSEEVRAISLIKENPKYFYTYARNKSTMRSNVGPLEMGGEIRGDPEEMCEILQTQYTEMFSEPRYQIGELIQGLTGLSDEGAEQFSNVEFTEGDVMQAIKMINSNSSPGPDGVPPILLKKCINTLSKPIYLLWKKSLEIGKIPTELKEAIITPIHKGGSRGVPANYRPVSLTSHIIKIFERILGKFLIKYLEDNKHLNERQHGFRKSRSCLSQLLQHYHLILKSLEAGRDVDVVYLDFAKAFDKVDLGILIQKLHTLGVRDRVLRWISNFLINRRQKVTIRGYVSRSEEVVSGVPQGTVLGPLLFLAHVSDIDRNIRNSTVSSFADDTRLLKSINTNDDRVQLQEDLNIIYNWASENNMMFNNGKFELLQYSTSSEIGGEWEYRGPSGERIGRVECTRDLGVIMTDTGDFDQHIERVVTRSKRKIGWIWRTFRTRKVEQMLTLYKSLILPTLEYCCQLWCPSTVGMIQSLEAVQRTFTARLSGMKEYDYWQRLEKLSLYSLERRRDRYRILYTWKMANGDVPKVVDGEGNGLEIVNNARRGWLFRIPQMISRSSVRVRRQVDSSIMVMGPRLFNSLPKQIRDNRDSFVKFKHELDEYLQTVPDQPPLPHYYKVAQSNSVADQYRQMTE